MKTVLVSLTVAVIATLAPASNAYVVESPVVDVAKRDLKITHSNMVSKEDGTKKRLYVELNDGSIYLLRKCKYEDSPHCYWNAGTMGNGKGKSFVSLRGRVFYKNVNV